MSLEKLFRVLIEALESNGEKRRAMAEALRQAETFNAVQLNGAGNRPDAEGSDGAEIAESPESTARAGRPMSSQSLRSTRSLQSPGRTTSGQSSIRSSVEEGEIVPRPYAASPYDPNCSIRPQHAES